MPYICSLGGCAYCFKIPPTSSKLFLQNHWIILSCIISWGPWTCCEAFITSHWWFIQAHLSRNFVQKWWSHSLCLDQSVIFHSSQCDLVAWDGGKQDWNVTLSPKYTALFLNYEADYIKMQWQNFCLEVCFILFSAPFSLTISCKASGDKFIHKQPGMFLRG